MLSEEQEIVFISGIEDDFIRYGISEERILKMKNRLMIFSKDIFSFSEKLDLGITGYLFL